MAKRKGIGGHQSADAETTTWLTPPHILKALGEFDLDPCAAPWPRPWDTAKTHYTLPEQNGLLLPWHGRVWVNPPYGAEMDAFLEKLGRHGIGTALIFARTETRAFFQHVWARADALLFLKGRLFFHRDDGTQAAANGGAPSVLIAYGSDDAEILHDCALDGAFVPLKAPLMLHYVLNHEKSDPTWREIVCDALRSLGGNAHLKDIYQALESHPKARNNVHWRAKIRQTLSRAHIANPEPAKYALAG